MGPRLSTGGNVRGRVLRVRDLDRASMGPRLSTGGNRSGALEPFVVSACFNGAPSLDGGEHAVANREATVAQMLQWGPVSRRGGTLARPVAHLELRLASMGPRLSTGGNAFNCLTVSTPHIALQWGPVSRRGGTRGAQNKRLPGWVSFNGAPSLDGGELSAPHHRDPGHSGASMGPRLSTGGNRGGYEDAADAVIASMGPRLSTGGNSSASSRNTVAVRC